MIDKLYDRCKGSFIGLAIGDALGTTNEFASKEEIIIIDDIVGGGPFDLEAGKWTDDTSMALCLAQSLIEKDFDLKDQLEKYYKWYSKGYFSSTGQCFDIGKVTEHALREFKKTGNTLCGRTDEFSSGNGSLMRLSPAVIRYVNDPEKAINAAVMQNLTTHGSPVCLEACSLLAEFLLDCYYHKDSQNKKNVFEGKLLRGYSNKGIISITNFDYFNKTHSEVFKENGYAVSSLEFALWCFHNTDSFRDCVLLAANSGGDADTNAAIAGQIAGAFYGYSSIPEEWLDKLYMHDEMVMMVHKLLKMV